MIDRLRRLCDKGARHKVAREQVMENFVEKEGSIPAGIRFRTAGDKELRLRRGPKPISEIEEVPIEWFWEPYIPLGRLSMLGGDPGAGKSFITTMLAATYSKGDCFPGDKDRHDSGNTLMLAVEDDPADTIKPRLRNLQADLTKIFISEEDIVLDPDGLMAIRTMIRQTKAKLVIIDPIVAFLGPKMDMNRANEVRHIMKGLAKIARELNIAILVVRHNRKEGTNGSTGKAIYAGMGSIDFTASVRSELAVVTSKNGTNFLNHIKSNSGRKGQSLTYEIVSLPDGSGLFRWKDFAAWPPASDGTKKTISTRFKNEIKIKRWLFETLQQHPEGITAKELSSLAQFAGYSQTKLDHIKKGIALSVKRGSEWYWTLDPSARVDLSDEDEV
jgi:hypothetical protein